MEQYISKSALVAEINKRIIDAPVNSIGHQRVWAYNDVKDIIDTLEIKEVDFDTLGALASHLIACDAHGISPKYSEKELDLLDKIENDKEEKVKEVMKDE